MICAKTADPIEIPFGMRTQVGPKNHYMYWVECTLALPSEYH